MEKLSQSFITKITNLQRRFESFLDSDFEKKVEEIEILQSTFEPSRDPALVRGISQGLPEDHVDRAIVIFSRLALLFDAGILLENYEGQWKAQASFYKGVTELLKCQSQIVLQLPDMNLMTVLKTDSASMLKKLKLEKLDPEKKTTCVLIKTSPEFAYLLFSKTADLWLKEHVENVRRSLINGIAD